MRGRVRFRVPSQRRDAAFFARVAVALREQARVAAMKINARTGSVLVEHGMTFKSDGRQPLHHPFA